MLFFSRTLLFGLLLSVLLSGCTEKPYTNIDNSELVKLSQQGIKVIDIRRPEEWRQTGVVDGSMRLTAFDQSGRFMPDFMSTFSAEVDQNTPVILICRTGNRTSALANFLAENKGYTQVYNVTNGITGWIRDGKPVSSCSQC